MKNFCIVGPNNKEFWISRSIAVIVALFAKDKNSNKYVLAVQRGKGTPDPEFVGKYCLPGGYLDYDETVEQAAVRELCEETGLKASEFQLKLVSVNSDPTKDKRQNVTFRYLIKAVNDIYTLQKKLTPVLSEKDEVMNIKFIKVKDIDKYEWAFNHNELIKEFDRL